VPHVELDAINHRPGWTEAPPSEFRAELRTILDEHAAARGGWIVDGNYRSRVAEVLDPDTYVWLDYPRRVVLLRILRRTLGRVLLRRELWNGNRERWSAVFSRDPRQNILLWSLTQHGRYQQKYVAESDFDATASWIRLRTPRDAERWLSTFNG